jgi:hypothetical protein
MLVQSRKERELLYSRHYELPATYPLTEILLPRLSPGVKWWHGNVVICMLGQVYADFDVCAIREVYEGG